MFPINLFADLVAIEPEPHKFDVALPDWQQSFTGKVIAVGPQAYELEVGDRVIFNGVRGMDGVLDGKQIRIMKEEDVEAVVNE